MVAIIIFTDIVGFSQLNSEQQVKLIKNFNKKVEEVFKPVTEKGYNQQKYKDAKLLFLPTGDGMAISLYYKDSIPSYECAVSAIQYTISLHQWAHEPKQNIEIVDDIELRIGISYGVVQSFSDVNGIDNIVGTTVNDCQRIMDAANGKQTLISDELYKNLIGDRHNRITTISKAESGDDITISFSNPLTVQVKHEKYQTVRQILLSEPLPQYYSNDEPESKYRVTIKLAQFPKVMKKPYTNDVSRASTIALIILSGADFRRAYGDGSIQFRQTLKSFYVFIPNPDVYKGIRLANGRWGNEAFDASIKEWKEFFGSFKKKYPHTELILGVYNNVLYFGGTFIDWEDEGGCIYIGPYIWGVVGKDCPAYKIIKPMQGDSSVYNRYITGLETLKKTSKNVIQEE